MMKVGFFGDGRWAYNSLKVLLKNKNMRVKFVALRKNKPDQNLIKLAKRKKLKFYIFKNVNNNFTINIIKKMKIDIIVSVSYDQIFKKKLIDRLKLGIINFK